MKLSERNSGLDLVRALAVFLVSVIHAFQYNGTLDGGLLSPKWTVMILIHYLSYASVPLFMLLSGYLMRNKKPCREYYAGLLKVLIPYLVISAVTVLTVRLAEDPSRSPVSLIASVFNFTANSYSWYVEMYIGLYLLIPFLNIMWDGITSKKAKLGLLAVLASMTFLPEFTESLAGGRFAFDILPDWWVNIYPIAYYFIGSAIAEFKPKLPKWVLAVSLAASLTVPTALNYLFTRSTGKYAWYMLHGFGYLNTALVSVSLFLLLYGIHLKPKPLAFAVREISVCSFEIYLYSFIADCLIYYTPLKQSIAEVMAKAHLPLFPVLVAMTFVISYIAARVTRLVSVPISRWAISRFSEKAH